MQYFKIRKKINKPINTINVFDLMLSEVKTINPALVNIPINVIISKITNQLPIEAAP